LGATSAGRSWCTKALHPSDPLTDVVGIPDESAFPSVFMNYQTIYTLSASPGATGTWNFNCQLVPHPIGVMAGNKTDSTGISVFEVLNSQVQGTTHAEKFVDFTDTFSRWRLAYMGVTVYQDGPDLANQGTITVCQSPVKPIVGNIFSYCGPTTDLVTNVGLPDWGNPHAMALPPDALPDFDSTQTMPNAYFNNSKFGAYVPLKLSRTHQEWKSISDSVYMADTQSDGDVIDHYDPHIQIPVANVNPVWGANGTYPFLTLATPTKVVQSLVPSIGHIVGDQTSPFCNDFWANICARNLSTSTSYSFFIRYGYECQCLPGTPLTPHQKLSPQYDSQAIAEYFAVSRELKDAYPADFNDLGKIVDVIRDAIKAISPAMLVSGNPLLAGTGTLLNGGVSMFDAIRRAAGSRQKQIASASDIDKATKAVAQVSQRTKRKAAPKAAKKPHQKRD